MRIGSIVIKCERFDEMFVFWREALHYVPREPAENGWVVLRDPEGRCPNVSLDIKHEDDVLDDNKHPRLHLDLYTDDREGEVKRLLGIGAKIHPQTYEPSDDFRVLEDPDGNLFCVVQK